MSYEVLVAMHDGSVGDVARVEPDGFAWGGREMSRPSSWLVVQVDSAETEAEHVHDLLTETEWRLRLSAIDDQYSLGKAAVSGVLAINENDFQHALESKIERRRFDHSAPDGQGQEWPDSDTPPVVESPLRRDVLTDI